MTSTPSERDEAQATPRRVSIRGDKAVVTIGSASRLVDDEQLNEDAVKIIQQGAHKPRQGNIAADQLRAIVNRIEKLEEEKAGIASDIADIYAESKGNGLCPKTLRKIIALRKKDVSERDEEQHLLDTYMSALGMLPLFEEAE